MARDIEVRFPGNLQVEADLGDFRILTDQRVEHGGDGRAPEPYQLFLASLATCAGFYAVRFCRQRDIPTDGMHLVQSHEFVEPGHVLSRVSIRLELPPDFPPRYREAIARAAETCAVRKALGSGPEVVVETQAAADGPVLAG